jgi:hypothetical protein
MTLETPFSRFAVRTVHIREAGGSSPSAPIFPLSLHVSLNVKCSHQRWQGIDPFCLHGSCPDGCEPCSKEIWSKAWTASCHIVKRAGFLLAFRYQHEMHRRGEIYFTGSGIHIRWPKTCDEIGDLIFIQYRHTGLVMYLSNGHPCLLLV